MEKLIYERNIQLCTFNIANLEIIKNMIIEELEGLNEPEKIKTLVKLLHETKAMIIEYEEGLDYWKGKLKQ